MLTSTSQRVSQNTADSINEQIRRRTDASVAACACAGHDAIQSRLAELDREWDIERYVETMAPVFTLAGLGLGLTVSRKWLLLSITVQGFFLQHALQGWCPPIPVLRSLSIRTMDEINQERYALKALRGDFRSVSEPESDASGRHIGQVLRAVRS